MADGDLFDWGRRQNHLRVAFEAFHAENPYFYKMFAHYTREMIDAGHRNLSARLIFHHIRWMTKMRKPIDPEDTSPFGPFKVNNNYSPFYARMFMDDYPEYDGFFRTRDAAADDE